MSRAATLVSTISRRIEMYELEPIWAFKSVSADSRRALHRLFVVCYEHQIKYKFTELTLSLSTRRTEAFISCSQLPRRAAVRLSSDGARTRR